MNLLSRCLISAALLAVALSASAQRTGRSRQGSSDRQRNPVLSTVFQKADSVKYVGTRKITFMTGRGHRSITEKVMRHGWKMRIEYPGETGFSGQVIVENGEHRLRFLPSRKEIRQLPPRRDEILFGLSGVTRTPGQERPTVHTAKGTVIAGVPTKLLVFKTKAGRVEQRMWVSEKHGAILKREVLDHDEEVSTKFEFISIRFNPELPKNTFKIDAPGVKTVTLDEMLARESKALKMTPYRLSDDAKCRLLNVSGINSERFKALVQSYSCRGGRVSLYQLAADVNPERLDRMAGDRYRTHAWKSRGVSFVLIGSVSTDELKSLAKHVKVGHLPHPEPQR
jgi:outer membrane lipoprotein-sorting protein